MQLLRTYFSTILCTLYVQHVSAESVVTPAPSPTPRAAPQGLRMLLRERRLDILQQRAINPGLNVCYSDNSICDQWGNLNDVCEAIPITQNDGGDWYKCLCETGWLAVHQACNWCNYAYNIDPLSDDDEWSSDCSSHAYTIAPIPSSILAIESSFNATNTILATGGGSSSSQPTGGFGVTALTSSGLATLTQSSSSNVRTSRSTVTATFYGGGDDVPTTTIIASIPDATVQPAPTSTSSLPAAGGGSGGGAQGLNMKAASIFSGLVTVISIKWVLIAGF